MSDTRKRKRGADLYRKVRKAIEEAWERWPESSGIYQADTLRGRAYGRSNRKARRALILAARREVGR